MSADSGFSRYDLYGVIGEGDYGTVFKALDTQTDTVVAVKVVAGYPSHAMNELDYEPIFISKINKRFDDYTPCIVKILDEGGAISLSELGKFQDVVSIIEGDDDFSEEDEEPEVDAFYFVLELLKDSFFESGLVLTTEEFIAGLFELYMTLDYMESRDDDYHAHEDMGTHNIMYVETQNVRRYKINGQDYVIKSRYLPKIIDWSPHVGGHHPSEPKWGTERLLYFISIQSMYPAELFEIFQDFKRNPSVEHSIFDSLRQAQVEEGETVKYFLEIKL